MEGEGKKNCWEGGGSLRGKKEIVPYFGGFFRGVGGLGVLFGSNSRKGSPKSEPRGECRKLPSFTVFCWGVHPKMNFWD